jgi:hypothetical protein
MSFRFIPPKDFKSSSFPIIWLWVYLMKVIPETWHIWWSLFQKRDVSDEGYSRNVTYLMKVILETWRIWWTITETWRVWWKLFQKRDVSDELLQKRDVSDEGYSRDVMYLMKVIPETWRIWWRLFQKRDVSDEGYSNTSRFWNSLHKICHVSGITIIKHLAFLE